MNLKEFYGIYKDYLKGINPCGISESMGLCRALVQVCLHKHIDRKEQLELDMQMRNQWEIAGLCRTIPFNNCMSEWTAEHRSQRMKFNYRRIQWVMDHA